MSTSFIIIYSDINRFLLYEWSGFLQGWQFLPDTHLISIPSSGIKYLPCDPALRDSGRKVLSNIIILLLCRSRHLSGTTTYIISFYLLNNIWVVIIQICLIPVCNYPLKKYLLSISWLQYWISAKKLITIFLWLQRYAFIFSTFFLLFSDFGELVWYKEPYARSK